jgi:hypothetical protein
LHEFILDLVPPTGFKQNLGNMLGIYTGYKVNASKKSNIFGCEFGIDFEQELQISNGDQGANNSLTCVPKSHVSRPGLPDLKFYFK